MTAKQFINHSKLNSKSRSSSHYGYKVFSRDNKNTVIVPAKDCLITSTVVTAKNKADLLAAIPYALEDELSEPVEQLHFVAGDQDTTGVNPVIVTSKKNMRTWIDSLPDEANCLLPDVLALPWKASTWTVVIDRDRALVRMDKYQGFECESDQLNMQLELLNRHRNKPKLLNIWWPNSMKMFDLPKDCARKIQNLQYTQRLEDWLLTCANPAYELNLLSGEFQPNNTVKKGFKHWLPAFSLLIVAMGLHAGFHGYQINTIHNETEILQQKAEGLFQEAFPETKRIVNPREQAEQKINEMKAQLNDNTKMYFLNLFADVMSVMKQQPGMKVKGFVWKQNWLQLQILAASVSQVEQFESSLKSNGLTVEILNAINKDGQFQAQLKIGGE